MKTTFSRLFRGPCQLALSRFPFRFQRTIRLKNRAPESTVRIHLTGHAVKIQTRFIFDSPKR